MLDRQRWRTRIEFANAIFEYLEIFHNRQRVEGILGNVSEPTGLRECPTPWHNFVTVEIRCFIR